MHSFNAPSCNIHYNLDLSGTVIINDNQLVGPGRSVEIAATDLIRFANEVIIPYQMQGLDRGTFAIDAPPRPPDTLSQKDILIHIHNTLSNYTAGGIDNFCSQINALLDILKEEANVKARIYTLIENSSKY